jgi:RNA-directed DNA polymerase
MHDLFDDMVILVNGYNKWLLKAAYKRLIQELTKLKVKINSQKTKIVDLTKGHTFSFLGFVYRRVKTRRGKWAVVIIPKIKARTALLQKLKEVFHRYRSQPISRIIYLINPIIRGWVNYFRIGNSSKCLGYVKGWVEKKIRRHLQSVRKRHGFGWNRWSSTWLYNTVGLYNDYKVRYYQV